MQGVEAKRHNFQAENSDYGSIFATTCFFVRILRTYNPLIGQSVRSYIRIVSNYYLMKAPNRHYENVI